MGRLVIYCVWMLLLVLKFSSGFYLPGLAPVSFCEDKDQKDKCKVKTNVIKT